MVVVKDFYERYIIAGNEARVEFYPNTTHAFALPFWYDNDRVSLNESLEIIDEFLQKHNYL